MNDDQIAWVITYRSMGEELILGIFESRVHAERIAKGLIGEYKITSHTLYRGDT